MCVPVCTTNLQILTVIFCIHCHIHHMSRTPFLILNFLDFGVYVPVLRKKVAILSLCSKQAIIVPNDLIDSQHFKRRNDRIPFPLTFHPHNHAVKSIIILNNFKLLQNDPETGRIFFATSTYFIQMQQKHRQLFS